MAKNNKVTTACESYLNAQIGDESKHKTEYVQYQTLRGKVITVCKHCKEELQEFKGFLAAMNDPSHPQRMGAGSEYHGNDGGNA